MHPFPRALILHRPAVSGTLAVRDIRFLRAEGLDAELRPRASTIELDLGGKCDGDSSGSLWPAWLRCNSSRWVLRIDAERVRHESDMITGSEGGMFHSIVENLAWQRRVEIVRRFTILKVEDKMRFVPYLLVVAFAVPVQVNAQELANAAEQSELTAVIEVAAHPVVEDRMVKATLVVRNVSNHKVRIATAIGGGGSIGKGDYDYAAMSDFWVSERPRPEYIVDHIVTLMPGGSFRFPMGIRWEPELVGEDGSILVGATYSTGPKFAELYRVWQGVVRAEKVRVRVDQGNKVESSTSAPNERSYRSRRNVRFQFLVGRCALRQRSIWFE